jgi:YebC/PmpR family DNA-binding regulatory protein
MSGHSKWATTKRHKASIDARRGKIFGCISKELTIAARNGGSDSQFNLRLRTIIQKAKNANMPSENIERAIKKGTGELPGIIYEEIIYEGYAPGGVGLIVEVVTDNRNRSASAVRSAFSKIGNELSKPGSLAFNFTRQGQFLISSEHIDEDVLMEIALEGGAQDFKNQIDYFEILCQVSDFDNISQALNKAQIKPDSAELAWISNNLVSIRCSETAKKIIRLIELLEDIEDVQNVWSNADIDDS